MNSILIMARSIARKTGVIRLIHRLLPARAYEEHFHKALTEAVKPGDIVWDVGANVGLYTQQFCEWVGPAGSVVAFEPDPNACAEIQKKLPNCSWLRIENIALGHKDTTGKLVVADGSYENHIKFDDVPDTASDLVDVVISTGDSVAGRLAKTPNVVKVDVEGFEEEVLQGMNEMLLSPSLRSVLVEVHFQVLEQRGQRTAPVRIEKFLAGKGFKTTWVDASHLVAKRLQGPLTTA